jgi:hypothetical protein
MTTSSSFKQLSPCYLALNRGIYCGPADLSSYQLTNAIYLEKSEAKLFTANIRRATPFASFEEAEAIFKVLSATKKGRVAISGYFAILAAPVGELKQIEVEKPTSFTLHLGKTMREIPLGINSKAHPASCICPTCCDY